LVITSRDGKSWNATFKSTSSLYKNLVHENKMLSNKPSIPDQYWILPQEMLKCW
jgi:hypothetical protein